MFKVFILPSMQVENQVQSLGQEIPMHPWTKLATDIFNFESSSYLLIVDNTSRFPVLHSLSSITGLQVANHCKQIFSEYGWPETLISDNGPCYTLTSLHQCYAALQCQIILRALHITHSQMVLLRSMSRL